MGRRASTRPLSLPAALRRAEEMRVRTWDERSTERLRNECSRANGRAIHLVKASQIS